MPEDIEALNTLLAVGTGLLLFLLAICIAALVIYLVGLCKIFKKAGKPSWAAIVPFYNSWVLVEVANLNWWWFLIVVASTIVSLLNLNSLSNIASFVGLFGLFTCYFNISKKFGKGAGFAVGMLLLPVIFIPILGMGKSHVYNSSILVSKNGMFGKPEESNSQPTYSNTNVAPVANVQPVVAPIVTPVVNEPPVVFPIDNIQSIANSEASPVVEKPTTPVADMTNTVASTDNEFIFCSGCGTKIAKGTAFCPNCGNNIAN